jgi:hypothetical protein
MMNSRPPLQFIIHHSAFIIPRCFSTSRASCDPLGDAADGVLEAGAAMGAGEAVGEAVAYALDEPD